MYIILFFIELRVDFDYARRFWLVVLPTTPIVKESWCREVRGKGRRGISFAWRQHRFFFVDFLLLALSYEKLEETGKEK